MCISERLLKQMCSVELITVVIRNNNNITVDVCSILHADITLSEDKSFLGYSIV
jgi:hypothetical protein